MLFMEKSKKKKKKKKKKDFSETIVVYDIKLGRCSQL